jgi:hypothetical protein
MLLPYDLPRALNFLRSRTRPRAEAPSRASDSSAIGFLFDLWRIQSEHLSRTTPFGNPPALRAAPFAKGGTGGIYYSTTHLGKL